MKKTLKKNLGLGDVIAICVGAMFSSGFFLLPGLAYAHTGPSVFLAYILSGFLIIPSLLSQAELSTAMPKSGGTYFFLDRTFGPIIGCIGGFGTYLGLVLKTAFALVGIGAYLTAYTTIPVHYISIGLTIAFVVLNLIGAKESSKLQKLLVSLLVLSMGFFIAEGLRTLFYLEPGMVSNQFTNFFKGGPSEFFYTIAFVFVSYSGLTKIASVAEEIKNPTKNIPLGMILSLLITMVIYGLGVFVVVGLVPADQLMKDLQPIATAESYAFHWIDGSFGLILVTVAAIASFASTGNAGILASSRYPLAMAKDKLLPNFFQKLNKIGVPHYSLIITGAIILLMIIFLNEEGIAKLASAFQLVLFLFLNIAVIIMRESKIETYDPGFKSPFYPWVQLMGIFISVGLLIYMGTSMLIDVLILTLMFYMWYYVYARKRVTRSGVLNVMFSNATHPGRASIKSELWEIMKKKGLKKEDPVADILSRAIVIDHNQHATYESLVKMASEAFSNILNIPDQEFSEGFIKKAQLGAMPITNHLCMSGLRLIDQKTIEMVIIRCKEGFSVDLTDVHGQVFSDQNGTLAIFLVSPENLASVHLRLIAGWIDAAESTDMVEACMRASSEKGIKHALQIGPTHDR